jgi:hypothetical protein
MSEPTIFAFSEKDYRAHVNFISKAQEREWSRLVDAIGAAINGYWSIEVESALLNIRDAARLVGPTDIGDIAWEVFDSGLYHAVLRWAEITHADPDPKRTAQYQAAMLGRRNVARYGACIRAAERLSSKGVDTIG